MSKSQPTQFEVIVNEDKSEEGRREQAHNLQGPRLSVQWKEVEARALTLALGEVVRDPRHNGGGKSKFRFPSWMWVCER